MGVDILILTDNYQELYTTDFFERHNDYSLSRTFCNFMCRQNACEGLPELDQIGKITGVDIMPLYEMETYGSESGEELEFFLEIAKTDAERGIIIENAKAAKEKLRGNICRVMSTVEQLISKLSMIDNLPELLDDNGRDTLNSKIYFADFAMDRGGGYIGNNFGHDLRNFKRFLEYAKSQGSQTVYFNYG